MNFIKTYWKLIVGGIIILIVLFWIGSVTGMNKKLYDMALDNLRIDQSRIVQTLEENQTMYEKEIQKLQTELERIKSQQTIVKAENEKLKGKISELQAQREGIVVSSDPDTLVNDLHKLGIKSAIRRK